MKLLYNLYLDFLKIIIQYISGLSDNEIIIQSYSISGLSDNEIIIQYISGLSENYYTIYIWTF